MTDQTAEPLHPHARDLDPPATGLSRYPPVERWGDWEEYDAKAWPKRVPRRYSLIPTICFNCEAACGLLAYVDKQTLKIQKFEGNPEHPGSRGRNCAKGPATLNQVQDPERIRYPLKRVGQRGEGKWERVTWDEVLDDIAGRIRSALVEGRQKEIMYHLGRPGHELVYLQRVFHAWGIDGHNSHTNVCSASARAGYAFWHGFDRPSPDHGRARFILRKIGRNAGQGPAEGVARGTAGTPRDGRQVAPCAGIGAKGVGHLETQRTGELLFSLGKILAAVEGDAPVKVGVAAGQVAGGGKCRTAGQTVVGQRRILASSEFFGPGSQE